MRRSTRNRLLVKSILFISLPVLVGVPGVLKQTNAGRDALFGKMRKAPVRKHDVRRRETVRRSVKIRLASGEFDPLIEPMPGPSVDRLVVQRYGQGQKGYYIVQFDGAVTPQQKDTLSQTGAKLLDYLPDFSFIVKMDEATRGVVESMEGVRWVGIYQPRHKITPNLTRILTEGDTPSQDEFIATSFRGEDLEDILYQIEQIGGEVLEVSENDFGAKVRMRIAPDKLDAIPHISGIKWIEPAPIWQLYNGVAAGLMTVPDVWNTNNLYGLGQVVAVADTGLDQGSAVPANLHDDFEDGTGGSRVSQIFDRVGDGASDVNTGHGTHVAGSVLGNGVLSGSNPGTQTYDNSYAGMAPEASLVFQAVENNGTGEITGIPVDLNTLFQQTYNVNARIHTNSWGVSEAGAYTSFSEDVDQFVWNNRDFLVLFAAGNDGVDADKNGVIDLTSVASPGTAKNCITVGATENDRPSESTPTPGFNSNWGIGWPSDYPANPINSDHVSDNGNGMAAFSSRGPTLDGRTKPDIVAPGTNIISTKSSLVSDLWGQGGLTGGEEDFYIFSGGTSMATPLVAGAATLVREFYTDIEAITPSAALVKATLLNGAADLTPGQYGSGVSREIPRAPRPNNVEGWGRLELESSIFPGAPRVLQYDDETAGLNTGGAHIYKFTVGDVTEPLKATLVWSDYPGSPVAGGGLVNDLDLILVDHSATWYYPNNASQRGETSVISYDDENYEESWFMLGPGAGFAVKFTPSSYPAILDKVRFFLSNTSTSAQFRCNVWDDNGSAGMPGTNLVAKNVTPPILLPGGWFTVDISGVTITSGSFYIEFRSTSTPPNNPNLSLDRTGPNNRSYVYDGASWSQLPSAGISNGDWAIQAVVRVQDANTFSDRVNNVVGVDLATPATGDYAIRIEGYNIPQGPQPYALVVTGGNVSPLTQVTPPQAPSNLTGQVISTAQVDLTWTDNSGNETGFRIERKEGAAGIYQEIDTVGADETAYSDTTTAAGPTYYYRVRSFDANEDDSAPSNEVSAKTGSAPVPPAGGGGGGGGCFITTAAQS